MEVGYSWFGSTGAPPCLGLHPYGVTLTRLADGVAIPDGELRKGRYSCRPSGMHELRRERLRELGQRVRVLRNQTGLTGAQLANRAGVAQPTISKIETGRMLPSSEVISRIAEALGVDVPTRDDLLAHLRRVDAEVADLRQAGGGALARQNVMTARERRAAKVECFQSAMVPSLLQTTEYARRALAATGFEDEPDISRAVAARLEGQAVLFEQERRFSFVLTESALRTYPGSPDVMPAQLAKVVDVSTVGNVMVGVVPWSARLATFPLHGFVIYDGSTVAVETFTSELLLSDEQEIAVYRRTLSAFREAAVVGDEMRELVSRITRDCAEWTDYR